MNVTDAAYDTVHQYPGGSEALAPRMGMSAATLRGKVNPNTDRNLLSLQEADTLMGRTGDYRILHALCAEHGFIAQRVDAPQSGNLITALLSAAAAKGDLAELVSEAMADNRITPNEADAIARACQQVMAALVQVSQHAEAASERGGV
ncbi:TPA: phage regulatory CII family protein [Stenotrophomonas maltophilia]|nr:phage regulatory CII family protein [Stenotrophomonas maltophilia]HEL4860663.1 phage regulatory CII family protein [Stenotrophomonas maltophilia]HEL7632477.1 phage regulatory CII family protein [Stenotrophomonas maltophilia]HEL7636182.1 phage regulatory CII family protein [Stenotrophomonas maltophilia]